MKEVKVRNFKYEIIKNIDSCLNIEELNEKVTDYFDSFDYIFGDYSYDKLRLMIKMLKTSQKLMILKDWILISKNTVVMEQNIFY